MKPVLWFLAPVVVLVVVGIAWGYEAMIAAAGTIIFLSALWCVIWGRR